MDSASLRFKITCPQLAASHSPTPPPAEVDAADGYAEEEEHQGGREEVGPEGLQVGGYALQAGGVQRLLGLRLVVPAAVELFEEAVVGAGV